MPNNEVKINRAPVLTLWAAVVAERLGHPPEMALTLGKAVAGLNAQSKGKKLGIFGEGKEKPLTVRRKGERFQKEHAVILLGRVIPVVRTPKGPRASIKGEVIDPREVKTYLGQKFGESLDEARKAFEDLAKSVKRDRLALEAFGIYEKFRPSVPEGVKGWGARGTLDLAKVRSMAR